MNDIDGILGIGPVDLTTGTVSDGHPVPTVTDNLYKEKLISAESIGISYVPTSGTSSSSGSGALLLLQTVICVFSIIIFSSR